MIAISYRREDSLPIAGRLYDRLQAKFGKRNVFMDFDSIPPGVDFREQIRRTIERSNLVIAVIGPRWLGEQSDSSRRIDDPTDFVRLEIKYALERSIPIIPLLVDNTLMPKPEKLPSEIEGLAFRNALPLDSGIDFHNHAERLINGICGLVDPASFPKDRPAVPPRTNPLEDPIENRHSGGRKSRILFVVFSAVAVLITAAALTTWFIIARQDQESAKGERLFVATNPSPRLSSTAKPEKTPDVIKQPTSLSQIPNTVTPSATLAGPAKATPDQKPQHGAPDHTEVSPKGDIIVEYWKSEPAIWLTSSNLQNKEQCRLPYETYDSVLFSPDEKWAIVGTSTLYQRARPEGVVYALANGLSRQSMNDQAWQFYVQQTAPPENTKGDPIKIETLAWEPDSSAFIIRTACFVWGVTPVVPAPYFCKYDVTKRKFFALSDSAIRQAAVKPWVAGNVKPNMHLPRLGYPLANHEKNNGDIDEFARQFVMMNQVNDSGVLLPFYDATVDYFDNGAKDHPFIRDDVEKYNERWPLRLNNITRPTKTVERGPHRYDTNYTITYYAESKVRGEWTSGQISTNLSIFVRDGTPRITSIKQTRLSSEKGKIGATQPTTAPTVAAPAAQSEKRFAGKWSGVLYLERTGPGGMHDTQTWDTILEISADETKVTLRTSLGAPTYRAIRNGRTLKWEEPSNGGSSPHSFTISEDGKTATYEGTSRPNVGYVNRGTGTFRKTT